MGKVEAEPCSVCKENQSKYRCPRCGAPYCSLACNKAHKAGTGGDGGNPPCTGKRAGPSLPAENGTTSSSSSERPAGVKRQRENAGGRDFGEGGGNNGEESTASTKTRCVRKGRDQWRGGREDREEEEWQISADQTARISGCAWLRAAVRDTKLQGLLTEIDQAHDREKALAFHRTNRQFGDFMDKLLLEIEEYRKGGVDEPEFVAADS